MAATNVDLMALLVNAMAGDRTGIPILVDAVKEAGHEQAGERLQRLLSLREGVLVLLGAARSNLREADDSLEAATWQGRVSAFEQVLEVLGEEVPRPHIQVEYDLNY